MPRVLDPSPVILQHAPAAPRRTLKRTASIASLPTPPRSGGHKKRQRKDADSGEDVEEDSESSLSEYEAKPISKLVFKSKPKSKGKSAGGVTATKTIVVDLEAEKAAEDLFWLGPSAEKKEEAPAATEQKDKEKRKSASIIGSAPPSPPPSPAKQVRSKVKTPRPALQRTTTVSSSDGELLPDPQGDEDGPIRDSPRNLFLVDSKKDDPRVPTQEDEDEEELEEAPTVSYVFRGKRQEFPNPLYNLPTEVYDRAKLPTSHPDFSPLPTVKRTRLFAKELDEKSPKDKKKRRKTHSVTPSPSSSPSRPKRKATTIKKPRHTEPA